jgi:hypothetical protein
MSFPLYDNLLKDINLECSDLTLEEKEELIKKIKKIDLSGAELIYSIIRKYQLENETDSMSSFNLPYKAVQQKTGIKFNLELLPNKLKQMIYKFVNMHTIVNCKK